MTNPPSLPRFLPRLARVIGSLTLTAADCGALPSLPRGASVVRSPVACEAPEGLCIACYQGDDPAVSASIGDPVGLRAVQAWEEALRTYHERCLTGTEGTIYLAWPAVIPKSAGPLALRERSLPEGLEYLSDLLEARAPEQAAALSQEGEVKLLGETRGRRRVSVVRYFEYDNGEKLPVEKDYLIPLTQALRVATGDTVNYGTPLCEGEPDPHQILEIFGELALVSWMIDEVRRVLDGAAVPLAERHVALVLRAMMSRVRIIRSGDSCFALDELVPRATFFQENDRLESTPLRPEDGSSPRLLAYGDAVLLGLSKLATL